MTTLSPAARFTASILGLALCTSLAHGQSFIHAGDVILTTDAGRTTVVTGSATSATPTGLLFPFRVFSSRLGDSGFPGRTSNPGFNSNTNDVASPPILFYAGQPMGITVRRAARKWDGQGFCTVPPETVRITRSGVSVVTPAADPAGNPAQQTPTLNLNIGFTANGDGFLHEHPAFALEGAASNGIYLVEMQAYIGSAVNSAPTPSAPFWVLLAQNALTADVNAASTWVVNNVASGAGRLCPCRADFDSNGLLQPTDIFAFLNGYFAGGSGADFNNDGVRSPADIFAFLNAYFAGCPSS